MAREKRSYDMTDNSITDLSSRSGLINAPNRVPEAQREVQKAYRAHNRIWRIVS